MTVIAVTLVVMNGLLCLLYLLIAAKHVYLHFRLRNHRLVIRKAFSLQLIPYSLKNITRIDVGLALLASAHACVLYLAYGFDSAVIVSACLAAIILYCLNRRLEQLTDVFGHMSSAGQSTSNNSSFDQGRKRANNQDSGNKTNQKAGKDAHQTWSTADAEEDYENALKEAQKWADEASTKASATARINVFEKKMKANIHPKDRMRYKLAIMLLTEKLKSLP